MLTRTLFIAASTLVVSGLAIADDDGSFLDPKYSNNKRPVVSKPLPGFIHAAVTIPKKSDTLALIAKQSPVRSQASRGTCSIFSATAMLESMLIINGRADATINLSEEWLEYIIMRRQGSEGSTSTSNFSALVRYGDVEEELMPYIGETWESADQSVLAQERCGRLEKEGSPYLQHCLLGHRDPALYNATVEQLTSKDSVLRDEEFLTARNRANEFRATQLKNVTNTWRISTTAQVKQLLAAGTPVTLDIDFYYGAWNHRKGTEMGIERNMDHWAKGIVFYPERNSLDREKSLEEPAGHSVLLVGFDDNVVVTKTVQMADGTKKEFSHKGVYYFKNSWGAASFGASFELGGKVAPGYGVIVQDYAHEYGGFYKMPVK